MYFRAIITLYKRYSLHTVQSSQLTHSDLTTFTSPQIRAAFVSFARNKHLTRPLPITTHINAHPVSQRSGTTDEQYGFEAKTSRVQFALVKKIYFSLFNSIQFNSILSSLLQVQQPITAKSNKQINIFRFLMIMHIKMNNTKTAKFLPSTITRWCSWNTDLAFTTLLLH